MSGKVGCSDGQNQPECLELLPVERKNRLWLFFGFDMEGEVFHLAEYLILTLDMEGLAFSEMGSTETWARCVGLNTTKVSKRFFKWKDPEGIRAKMWPRMRLIEPKDDWSEMW